MYLQIIMIGVCVAVAAGLQLEGLSTKKPRTSKFTIKPTGTSLPSTSSVYRINSTNNDAATCILIRTDGLLSIQYRDKLNEDKEADAFLPDHPELWGDCSESDVSSISMRFKGFTLWLEYKKTPGGERWYVNAAELTYSSSNTLFEHIDRPGLDVKLSMPRGTLMFPTPVGKSYTCDKEQVITMFSQDANDKSGHLAKLYLRDLRMQAFMYKAASTWGPSFQCSATGTYRDETAPVAVGSVLAVMVLLSITAYGIWRYYKVKKVQYGTME